METDWIYSWAAVCQSLVGKGKKKKKSQTTIDPDHDPLKLLGALGAQWEDALSSFGAAGGCMLGLE